jgi:glycosyltransferase involved in cell wall biosynthesis
VIYLCIPAHNEKRTIGVLLWKIRNVMAEFGREYEILVLDDASDDGTGETLRRYRRSLPLRIFQEEERIGYGKALERLIREAVERSAYPKRDAIVTLQADFTESPECIVSLVKTLEGGSDLVVGELAEGLDTMPRSVRMIRWAAPFFLGGAHRNAPVADPISGFRVFRVIVLKKLLRELDRGALIRADGWAANVELLTSAIRHARRIDEVPLEVRYDLRIRRTRLRPMETLLGLYRMRGKSWDLSTIRGEA